METNRTEALRTALQKELAPVSLEIIDDSARHAGHAGAREGGHFRVVVVADAHQRGYPCRVVQDCVAGSSREAHDAALQAMAYLQPGSLCQRDELIAQLQAGSPQTSD